MFGSVFVGVFCACSLFVGNVSSRQDGTNNTLCYKETGCFFLGYPWSSSDQEINVPQHPDEIDTKFFLTTRDNYGDGREEIKHSSDITSRDRTYVIIHGFYSSSLVSWVHKMEQALLLTGDVNVISVDWSKGCKNFDYMQAVANSRVVAAILSRFLRRMMKRNSMSLSKLHLIGHSVGAHLASYVGLEIPGISRITGLDPSLPGFTLKEIETRLDPGDAKFVDVVHTNAGTFGHRDPLGHVDFYMNGGNYQPGCSFADIRKLYRNGVFMEYLRCSHSRAQMYFIESLQSDCKFWGRPWDLNGTPDESGPCNKTYCQVLGLESTSLPARGVFYVSTNGFSPYCKTDNSTINKIRSKEDHKWLRKEPRKLLKKKWHHKKHRNLIYRIIQTHKNKHNS